MSIRKVAIAKKKLLLSSSNAQTCHTGRTMLHTARDLDDACHTIIFNKRRDHFRALEAKQAEDHKAKVAAVSLPKLKWMGQI
jgi:hypothetical protein